MTALSRRELLVFGAAALLLPPGLAHAHHGWGSYDADNPLEITGRIESIVFDWPHAEMMLATDNGTLEIVLAPPSRTRARGLLEEVAQVGREVTVMGYRHRSRPEEVRVEWVQVDGETYRMR